VTLAHRHVIALLDRTSEIRISFDVCVNFDRLLHVLYKTVLEIHNVTMAIDNIIHSCHEYLFVVKKSP
jgi:hypothetical protein